ncbi:MAG: glycosyltransferase family 2 protein [Syntrophales bacterium]
MNSHIKRGDEKVDLSIIIVSYNTRDLIGACLDSIVSINDCGKEVFVVDNASTDGSVELIKNNYPSVHIIINKANRGFAAANNQALKLSKGRYIFFLNPDAEFLPSTFQHMISFMDQTPHVGLAGVKMINADGTPQESFSRSYPGQSETRTELLGLRGNLASVLGAAMIANAELLRRIGGFDEDFFMYGEDEDLCLRIRKMGYEIGYLDFFVVVHLRAQSERRSTEAEVWRKKTLAEFIFYHKHYLPATIRRIYRSYILKTCWRILTLKALLPFSGNKQEINAKLSKYQVIYDIIQKRKETKAGH